MYRFTQPIYPGVPRLVGAAGGNYIGPPGPNFSTQQWILPSRVVPHENDPKFLNRIASIIRRINFPRLKARSARPRSPHAGLAVNRPLKIGCNKPVKPVKPGIPHGLEHTGLFDVLGYSPRYLVGAWHGNAPRRLPGVPPLKAGNRAVAGLEHTAE